MNFKSLPQLLDYFKEESTCIKYYENIRWAENPVCPHCATTKPYKTNRGYKCSNGECHKKFTVKVGTIFEGSKISFRTWFAAIYLCTTHKKGISSVQLSIDLNITQKTAWFMLHRIREMLRDKAPQVLGEAKTVEIDEAYVGGVEANRHKAKKRSGENIEKANDGTKYNDKKVVIGIIERDGKIVLKHVAGATNDQMLPVIYNHIPKGTTVYTDESNAYFKLRKTYDHETIIHSLGQYVNGTVHTNTIENFWSQMKRTVCGTYHVISAKHLDRYLHEFSARFNSRDVDSQTRFEAFLSQAQGGLLYKQLIAKK